MLVRLGQEAIAELLIKHGAEIDLLDDFNRSALHWASRLGNKKPQQQN